MHSNQDLAINGEEFRKAAEQGNEDAKEILKEIDFDLRYKDEENSNRHYDIDACIIHIFSFLLVFGLISSLISWIISFFTH